MRSIRQITCRGLGRGCLEREAGKLALRVIAPHFSSLVADVSELPSNKERKVCRAFKNISQIAKGGGKEGVFLKIGECGPALKSL